MREINKIQSEMGITYLGISTSHDGAAPRPWFNAIAVKVDANCLKNYDAREGPDYKRTKIKTICDSSQSEIDCPMHSVNCYDKPCPKQKFWIYEAKNNEILKSADAADPIVQSYVDLFVGGCIQNEVTFF